MSEDWKQARPEVFDAVVVGSGFGGSITGLRLAQAGKATVILERGRRYSPGSFPRDVRDVDRLFWQYPKHRSATGLYDIRFFSGIGTVVASGVGGGSLIYANVLIRPDAAVFEDERWPAVIRRHTLEPYYQKVSSMLGASPVPSEWQLPKRDIFRQAASALGRSVFDPDEAVAWKDPPGAGREPCRRCTECEFGCQYGAKNTLDFTYLAQAEAAGADLRTGLLVTHLAPVSDGYQVHCTDIRTGSKTSVVGRRVVLAAGTLGTNEVLLRSRDEFHTLPKLSARLGEGYSGNGDFLGSIQHADRDLHPWDGPDVTSVMRFFDETPSFTIAAPSFNQRVMEVLAGLGQPNLGWLRWLGPLLWPFLGGLVRWAFRQGLFNRPSPVGNQAARMTNLFAIGRDNANGRIHLRHGRLDIEWDYATENAALIESMQGAMKAIARSYGGRFAPIVFWELFRRTLTVHSLGGCRLAETPELGVVSPDGQLFGYDGIFVADGSVVPTAIGFHPCMTIAALAERIAERLMLSF